MNLVSHVVAFGAVALIALGVAFTNVSADNGRTPLADHERAANDPHSSFADMNRSVSCEHAHGK